MRVSLGLLQMKGRGPRVPYTDTNVLRVQEVTRLVAKSTNGPRKMFLSHFLSNDFNGRVFLQVTM